MAETETIKPALTPEEWVCGTTPLPGIDRGVRLQQSVSGLYVDGKHYVGAQLHALAALALYGQPYGFTREDVENLRAVSFLAPNRMRAFDDLAARISALLPPEGV